MDSAFRPLTDSSHRPTLILFLNNREKTMSGAALFGLALISGSKAVLLSPYSRLSHWWFSGYVEGYVRSLRLPLPTSHSFLILTPPC